MLYNRPITTNGGECVDTKKCPKCGEEIPVEMQFCLHCMERTDGVLEIKQKQTYSKKQLFLIAICILLLLTGTIMFLLLHNNKAKQELPQGMDSESSEITNSLVTTCVTDALLTKENTTTASVTITTNISESNASSVQTEKTSAKDSTETILSTQETVTPATNPPAQITTAAPTTSTQTVVNTAEPVITENFEDKVRTGVSGWGGSNVDTTTFSFYENSCTFSASASGSPLFCTVSSDTGYTTFTMKIEQTSDYASYSMGNYVPDQLNLFSTVLLSTAVSSDLRGNIRTMLNNFETEGTFSSQAAVYTVTVQKEDNGTKTAVLTGSLR